MLTEDVRDFPQSFLEYPGPLRQYITYAAEKS
jgi:hypothetical protein